jgi:membrane-bound metal-dependent hydrolase YbcI (DUF457 family)
MFIGHYALAFAAKRIAARTSLGTLVAAPTLADILWPVFLLLGWERVTITPASDPFLNLTFDSYPITHSLLALVGWGLLFGILYRMRAGDARGALLVALLVVSHWVLDFVVHRPDLPLYPGGPKLGLGLWNSVRGTISVEAVMFVAGIGMYLAATRARDRVGRYGLWGLVVVLAASYGASLVSPPPPSVTALAIGAIVFGWLFVVWAGWVDGHREAL